MARVDWHVIITKINWDRALVIMSETNIEELPALTSRGDSTQPPEARVQPGWASLGGPASVSRAGEQGWWAGLVGRADGQG